MPKHYTINKDVKLRKGGRTICKMSDKQFAEKAKELINKVCDKYSKERIQNTNSVSKIINNIPYAIRELYWEKNTTVFKDFKGISPDWENYDLVGSLRHVKGAPYITMRIGGDWECPICVMCYYDGKEFRCYVPEKGNAFRKDLKILFGNVHSDYNSDSDKTRYKNDYVLTDNAYAFRQLCKEGTLDKNKDIKKKSGIGEYIQYDLNMCIEDFESRVEVKNNLKESVNIRNIKKQIYNEVMESVSHMLYKKVSINENGINYESNQDYCEFNLTGIDYLYIGDPCYCLRDEIYDNVGGDKYESGIITDKKSIVGCVHHTAEGDGFYMSDSGMEYSVDSGNIGIFDSRYCEEDIDDNLVKVIELDPNEIYNIQMVYEDGTFTFNIKNDNGSYIFQEVIYTEPEYPDDDSYDEDDYDDSYDELEDYDDPDMY